MSQEASRLEQQIITASGTWEFEIPNQLISGSSMSRREAPLLITGELVKLDGVRRAGPQTERPKLMHFPQ
jgi:hypothetical protein